MFCKFCGAEIGESTSCPVCNDGKNALPSEEKSLEEQVTLNEDEAEEIEENRKRAELVESLNKKTKPLKFVGMIFNTMPVTIGGLIPIILYLNDALPLPQVASQDERFIAMLQIGLLGFCLGCIAKGFYDLIEKLILRSMMKAYNMPLSELTNKLAVNGKIENKHHFLCLVLHWENKNGKLAFLHSALYIAAAIICGILSYLYSSDLLQRCEMAGGLPETGKVWFFITPLAAVIATIVIAYMVVETIVKTKYQQITIKNN